MKTLSTNFHELTRIDYENFVHYFHELTRIDYENFVKICHLFTQRWHALQTRARGLKIRENLCEFVDEIGFGELKVGFAELKVCENS